MELKILFLNDNDSKIKLCGKISPKMQIVSGFVQPFIDKPKMYNDFNFNGKISYGLQIVLS